MSLNGHGAGKQKDLYKLYLQYGLGQYLKYIILIKGSDQRRQSLVHGKIKLRNI